MKPTRRELIGGAASVAGMGLLPRTAVRKRPESGLVTGEPRALAYPELPGFLSKEQLRWHHDSHYAGALNKFTALDAAVTGDHKARSAKANSVILHELYFANMTAQETSPGTRHPETDHGAIRVDRTLDG
ncbi:MAG: hypothetical protein ACI8QZ_003468 [Chlamydiales bacterium]|jgi:hypothetical protein